MSSMFPADFFTAHVDNQRRLAAYKAAVERVVALKEQCRVHAAAGQRGAFLIAQAEWLKAENEAYMLA